LPLCEGNKKSGLDARFFSRFLSWCRILPDLLFHLHLSMQEERKALNITD
jgi:hypothetical protein